MKKLLPLFTFFLLICACNTNNKQVVNSSSTPIQHDIWHELLQKHVSPEGKVNYKGFITEKARFQEYLDLLNSHHPNGKNWSKQEQLAYWINAYNAYTVELIVDNYPVESIKKIKKGIPFINSVWDKEFITIEGHAYSLGHIEHEILRKEFDEPRIHFAIVCASISCPKLLNAAYKTDQLEQQFVQQTKDFINDPTRNKIDANEAKISKIFSWFEGDFTKNGTLEEYLSQYSNTPVTADTKISYLNYDWGLNE